MIAGALALGRVLRTQLFGVEPADPAVLAGMTTAFALCSLVATAWPARSAASLDPAAALKDRLLRSISEREKSGRS